MKKLTTKKLTYTALFTALVYIFSAFFEIPFMTPMGQTRFHLGNVFCLLGGLLLGPGLGGLAGGLGSALYDLSSPVYFSSAPFTFINKFLMGFVAGKVLQKGDGSKKKVVLASTLGQLTYIFLYLLQTLIKDHYLLDLTRQATGVEIAQKGGVSLINGVISVILATIFAKALKNRVKID